MYIYTLTDLNKPGSDLLSLSVFLVCSQPCLQCFPLTQLCLDTQANWRLWVQPQRVQAAENFSFTPASP